MLWRITINYRPIWKCTRERFAKKHILFEDDLNTGIAALLAPRDELEHRISTSYPYPLASEYRSLTAGGDPRDLYREQLRFAENILAFLASVSLSILKKEDRGKAGLDFKKYWAGGISPGDWKEIIQRCSKVFDKYKDVSLATAIRELNIGSEKKDFGHDVKELIMAKNDYKHDRAQTDLASMEYASIQVHEKLRRCMKALAFLTEYPILKVEQVDADPASGRFYLKCLRYVGADSDLPREERCLSKAPSEDELYLDLGDDTWVSLYPFMVPGSRLGSEATEIHFIDAWHAKKGSRMKSFERGRAANDTGIAQSLMSW
jgi:hypothetical protein